MGQIDHYHLRPDDRILYLRLSSLGDVVNAIPGLVALRRSFPRAYIAWCVEEPYADLLEGHPMLDEILVIPSRWRRPLTPGIWGGMHDFIKRLRALDFTVAIDAQNLLKSSLVAWLSGAPIRAGADLGRNYEGHRIFLNLFLEAGYRGPDPAARYRAEFLRHLGVDLSQIGYILPTLASERGKVEAMLTTAGVRENDLLIVLNPCASRLVKQWPGEYYVDLGRRLTDEHRASLVWTGAHRERVYIDGLARSLARPSLNLAGKLSLRELAALLARADLLVTGDTGPMHIGAAAGTYIVALMGPTGPEHYGPYTARRLILTADVPCLACGRKQCSHLSCLRNLKPDYVAERVACLFGGTVL